MVDDIDVLPVMLPPLVYRLDVPMDDGHGEDIGEGVKQPESYDVGSNFRRLPGQMPCATGKFMCW